MAAAALPVAGLGASTKAALRRACLARRAALGGEIVAAFDEAVPEAALTLVARHAAAMEGLPSVALYAAMPDEAPTSRLAARLAARGLDLSLPVIVARASPLRFRRWRLGDALRAGPLGILEPVDGEYVAPDMLFVPLVAFDAAAHRLGYGGGYYDRTLAALRVEKRACAVGLAFAAQEVDAVPREMHDVALDAVLTEHGLAVDRMIDRQLGAG